MEMHCLKKGVEGFHVAGSDGKHGTLDLTVMSSNPVLGMEPTYK